MKTRLLIGAVAWVALSASAQNTASGISLSSNAGRFVYGQVSSFRRDQFMLDTQTGKLWQLQCLTPSEKDPNGCSQLGLIPVVYTDVNGNTTGLNPPAAGR